MGQTRVKAGHIELVQGSKYTKNVKRMRWICARDKRRSNRSKSIFSLWVIRVFAEFYYFCVHCLFSSQENNSKQSVAHKLIGPWERNCPGTGLQKGPLTTPAGYIPSSCFYVHSKFV